MKKHFIPQNLRFLRRQQCITQQHLSEKLQKQNIPMSRSRYEGLESGRNEPNIDLIKDLSEFYGLSIDAFCFKDLSKSEALTMGVGN